MHKVIEVYRHMSKFFSQSLGAKVELSLFFNSAFHTLFILPGRNLYQLPSHAISLFRS